MLLLPAIASILHPSRMMIMILGITTSTPTSTTTTASGSPPLQTPRRCLIIVSSNGLWSAFHWPRRGREHYPTTGVCVSLAGAATVSLVGALLMLPPLGTSELRSVGVVVKGVVGGNTVVCRAAGRLLGRIFGQRTRRPSRIIWTHDDHQQEHNAGKGTRRSA